MYRLSGLAFSVLLFVPVNIMAAERLTAGPQSQTGSLGEALTFHASFDKGPDADFALGDARLYTAPSYDESGDAKPGIRGPDVDFVSEQGRFGAALRFNKKNTHAVFYRAEDHVAYSSDDWSGTISFWLSLDPAEDLEPGFCDPIQITDSAYNDAAVWVDFTRDNPRQFRLGVFGDLTAWNPENISGADNPAFTNRVVVVKEPPFERGQWTHVVITYSGLNSDSGGSAKLYLNGQLQGTARDIGEPFTWNLSRAQIRIGVNYVGMYDELALFNRPLNDDEVLTLYRLEGGVTSIHP